VRGSVTIDPPLLQAVSEALQQSFDPQIPGTLDSKLICLMIELSHVDPVHAEREAEKLLKARKSQDAKAAVQPTHPEKVSLTKA
jgi:hypothetical protein